MDEKYPSSLSSPDLFILVLEDVLAVINSNKKINSLKVFEYEFLYAPYADDAMIFLKNQKSLKVLGF